MVVKKLPMEKNEFQEIILSKEKYFFKIKPQTDKNIEALGELEIFLHNSTFSCFFYLK